MLDTLPKDKWEGLSQAPGKRCDSVSLVAIGKGAIVQVHTESDSRYLLEIVDPASSVVRFIRVNARSRMRRGGCRMSGEIRVGGSIRFGEIGNPSSRIKHLAVLEPAQP